MFLNFVGLPQLNQNRESALLFFYSTITEKLKFIDWSLVNQNFGFKELALFRQRRMITPQLHYFSFFLNRSEFRQNLIGTIIRVLVQNLRAQSKEGNHQIDKLVSVQSEQSPVCPPQPPPPPSPPPGWRNLPMRLQLRSILQATALHWSLIFCQGLMYFKLLVTFTINFLWFEF